MCPACRKPTHRGRTRSFFIGAALVFGPVLFHLLWIAVLGQDFVDKRAQLRGFDERKVYIVYCMVIAAIQIAALRFLNRSVRWRIDLISVGSMLLAFVSILLVVFTFVLIIGIAMGGAG